MNKRHSGNEGFEIFGLVMLLGVIIAANQGNVTAFLEKVSAVAAKVLTISIYAGVSLLVLLIGFKITKAVLKAKKRKQQLRIQALEKELERLYADRKYFLENAVAEAFHFGVAEQIADAATLDVPLIGSAKFSETNHVYLGTVKNAKIQEIERELYGYPETRSFEMDVVYAVTGKVNQARMDAKVIEIQQSFRTASSPRVKAYARQ